MLMGAHILMSPFLLMKDKDIMVNYARVVCLICVDLVMINVSIERVFPSLC